MFRKHIVSAVVRYLEERNYQFLCFLGNGGFTDVISVLYPAGQKVVVKWIQKTHMWAIEEEYWPTLQHANIFPVIDVMIIEQFVRLYFMPLLPRAVKFSTVDKCSNQSKLSNVLRQRGFQIIDIFGYFLLNVYILCD